MSEQPPKTKEPAEEQDDGIWKRILDKASIMDFVIFFTLATLLPSTVMFAYWKIIDKNQFMLILNSTLFVIFAAMFKKSKNNS